MESEAQSKILVLGAGGQLGQDLLALLPKDRTIALRRDEADLTKPEALRRRLAAQKPGLVFNCAAYNLVDRAEEEPEAAFAVNAFGPFRLAETCRDFGAALVHFSTDYVFGLAGFRADPFLESDAPGPTCVYGASKLAGEHLVRLACPRHFIIRTSGLYGRHGAGGKGGNFVKTMLRLAHQGKPLRVVEDQILSPTFTEDLAEATLRLIEAAPYGLYHLTNAGRCSWFEFAQALFEIKGLKADLSPCLTSDRNDRARRPEFSVLGTEHQGTPRLRPWRAALAAYLAALP